MARAAVVVKDGSLVCSHTPQGRATVSSVSARLTVGGKGVLLSGQEPGLAFSGCGNKTTDQTHADAPCSSQAATAGVATKLTVGRTAVLLATAGGSTLPTVLPAATGTWKVADAGQSKLTAL